MAERTALVVGASRGLGLGLVKELGAPASAKGLTDFAAEHKDQVRLETLDLEDSAGIDALAQKLGGETLDLLFVNAGISLRGVRPSNASRDDVARLFVTNVVAPLHVAEALVGQVRKGSGVIAMMSSGLGSVAAGGRGAPDLYSASKAALNKLTRGFAAGVGDGITVLSISPGWVRTDMGGPQAMLSVEDSCRGVIDVVEAKAGTGAHGFYNQDGASVPW
jgi:NAD(P)-dependent dehydrogenase (short-subunit alcohol dehydrogenase family)